MKTRRILIMVVLAGLLLVLLILAAGCNRGSKKGLGMSMYYPIRTRNQDWDLIDLNGNYVGNRRWKRQPSMETEGICYVRGDDGYDYYRIYKKKSVRIGGGYTDVSNFSEGLAAVVVGKDTYAKIQYIDRKGEVRLSIEKIKGHRIVAASTFSEGLAWVKDEEGKYGFINTKGELVIPFEYDDAQRFREGLAKVSKDAFSGEKTGFINPKGEVVIPLKNHTEYHDWFKDGYCAFYETIGILKGGVIDTKGNIVVKANEKYQSIFPFFGGTAIYSDGEACGMINTKGEEIVPAIYDYLIPTQAGAWAVNGFKHGALDFKGNAIFPLTSDYELVTPLTSGRFLVRKKSDLRFVDSKNKIIRNFPNASMEIMGIYGSWYSENHVEIPKPEPDWRSRYYYD